MSSFVRKTTDAAVQAKPHASRGRGWGNAEEAEMRRLYVEEGLSVKEIAQHLERSTGAVAVRLSRLGLSSRNSSSRHKRARQRGRRDVLDEMTPEEARDHEERQKKQKIRQCMTCECEFLSQGAHNRMCEVCRTNGSGDFVMAW